MSWDAEQAIERRLDAVRDALQSRPGPWTDPYVFAISSGPCPSAVDDPDGEVADQPVFWVRTENEAVPLVRGMVDDLEKSNMAALLMGAAFCGLTVGAATEPDSPVRALQLEMLLLPWGVAANARDYVHLVSHLEPKDVPPERALVIATARRPRGWIP